MNAADAPGAGRNPVGRVWGAERWDAPGPARQTPVVLGGAALALGSAFAAMAWIGDLYASARSFVLLLVLASAAYGIAAVWIVRRPSTGPGGLVAILAAAVAFRLILLPTPPTLSTDLYRYLWDGRLGAAGASPYRDPPNAPALEGFRDATIYPRLNHTDWRTIYPPGAQLLFAAAARLMPGRVAGFKAVVVAFDLLALGLLMGWLRSLGRPPAWALVYAWHPLVVVELAGSGHLDAVVLALTVGALWAATRGRDTAAGALVGLGTLVKLYPALLLPAVWGRRPGRALAAAGLVVAAGYALYARDGLAVLGSLGRYLAEEEFNAGVRGTLDALLVPLGPVGLLAARVLPLGGLLCLAGGIALWGREAPPWRRALWLVAGYLVATPNLFPWYALWIVPVLAVRPLWPWLHLTCAVGLTYLIFAEPVWEIPRWVVAAEFVPLGAGLAWAARPGRLWGGRPRPAEVPE